MEMSFYSNANKSHFHMKGFAPSLALTTRHSVTRKWPIPRPPTILGENFLMEQVTVPCRVKSPAQCCSSSPLKNIEIQIDSLLIYRTGVG